MTAVTAHHVLPREPRVAISGRHDDRRIVGARSVDGCHLRIEMERCAVRLTCHDQVFHDLLLAVDRDRVTVVEITEGDALRDAVEADLDPMMDEAFGAHARTDPGLLKEVRDAVLDDARTHALLNVVATASLND